MSRRAGVASTQAQITGAIKAGRRFDRSATKIILARYDRESDMLVVQLSTGATLSVPRRLLPRFELYTPEQFGDLTIEPTGYAVWFDQPDIGVRIEGIVRAASGESVIREFAATTLAARDTNEGGTASDGATTHEVGRRMRPGDIAPLSGQYVIVGPRGGRGAETTVVKGQKFPPTPTPGSSYIYGPSVRAQKQRK
jgi:hypothetical protein